ncbi:hypothetical protein SEVIR_8G032600v4 [Setaria viridis]|uniref:Rx N-terminal domain-containing protein n=1 Tax=Setaria viridis TaxID=4556 RepID=A0A4U6TF33_SETVI|nr:hypothetical protein SEVIR_8G032600v2 [Setaria viridis]
MADFVLGLAKTAVEGTLNMAKSAIEEEKQLQKSVNQGLIVISDEFEIMHSFLIVTTERATNDRYDEDIGEAGPQHGLRCRGLHRFCRPTGQRVMLAAVPLVALDDVVATVDLLKAMEHRNLRYSHIGDSSFESSEHMHPQAVANATALGSLHARDPACESSQVDLIKLINKEDGPLQVK